MTLAKLGWLRIQNSRLPEERYAFLKEATVPNLRYTVAAYHTIHCFEFEVPSIRYACSGRN